MMMIFSMTSSFVFAEGLDAAAPVDEPTVEDTTVSEETPEEVTDPVADGAEEVKEEAAGSKLVGKDVEAESIDRLKVTAALVDNTNSVKVAWEVPNLQAGSTSAAVVNEVKIEFFLGGEASAKYTGEASATEGQYTQTGVAAGTYTIKLSVDSEEIGSTQITVPAVPEAITGFATFSAYKSVVLEWNKPATKPDRYEIWSDGAKIADVTDPTSPYDNGAVYNFQCTNAGDEGFHTYMVKAVNGTGDQTISVQTEAIEDQMLMPMYIRCTFNQTKVLKSHDKAKVKHKFRKGDVVKCHMFVKGQYRFYYNGNLFYCNYNRLTKKKALYNGYGNWNYSDREAEYFINTAGETSMTKYLIFVNLYTQHLYLLTGTPKSKGQWKVTTVNYKGKKYRDWEVASGKAATPTPGGLKLKFKHKPVNIYRKSGTVYGHKTKNWNFYHSQTALHGRVGKAIYGKPRSLGCIRNTDAQAIFIKKVIPMKTRVAIY